MSGRFAREQRLLTSSDFKYVFDRPVKQGDNQLLIFARPNQRDHARLGLAIPKRQIRRAVDRNRLKRLIRESFRAEQSKLVGLDLVVMARSGAEGLSHAQVQSALAKHWQKLRQKCAES